MMNTLSYLVTNNENIQKIMDMVSSTTIVGRVPIGTAYLDESISQGEIVVVMCPKCKQLLIEYEDHIDSDTYPMSDDYQMGVVERGSYGATDRMYCFCGITTNVPDSYCQSGQFAICWNPTMDDGNGGGCAHPVSPGDYDTKLQFDYKSFRPQLEWFEVGVLRVHDPQDNMDKVFVPCDCICTDYQALCLNCHQTAIVSTSFD